MLGFNNQRRAGDVWVVDGEAFDAMVHPTVKGHFRGRAVVAAVVIDNESPVRTVREMNGFKLKFVPHGLVEGRSHVTDLCFVVETVDGGVHETKLVPGDGVFAGEIWLDTENQTVSYGKLSVDKARYDGYLPRIGELNARVKLAADLNFALEYTQSISPSGDE